jgi:molybdate transport system substrate-binding protein
MKARSGWTLAASAAVAFSAISLGGTAAEAAEIKLIASNGVTAIMDVLGPEFEKETGNKLVIHYDVANLLKKAIEGGEAFDVAILTGPVTDDLIKEGKIAGPAVGIARSGIGVAIRLGAPKPDISSTAAFKQALLDAKSIAYTTQGASGQYFAALLVKLGIADQVKAKSKLLVGGRAAELVARGEADMAVQQISELLPVAGTEIAGPLPPELQKFTDFTAGTGAGATNSQGAAALIKFLAAPAHADLIKSKGMEPG